MKWRANLSALSQLLVIVSLLLAPAAPAWAVVHPYAADHMENRRSPAPSASLSRNSFSNTGIAATPVYGVAPRTSAEPSWLLPFTQAQPSLSVVSVSTPVLPGETVQTPIIYAGNGSAVAAVVFSIDYEPSCLQFAGGDANNDGLPDGVQVSTPPDVSAQVSFDQNDGSGEIDFVIADLTPPLSPLPDGALAVLTFTALCDPSLSDVIYTPVNFSAATIASFSNLTGQSVPGSTTDGFVAIAGRRPTVAVVGPTSPIAVNSAGQATLNFQSFGYGIGATTFSLDFDSTCLALDGADADGNGMPDGIVATPPSGFVMTSSYDATDSDGEIDIAIYALTAPVPTLPDGLLATLTFTATCDPGPGTTQVAPIDFSPDPTFAFADTSGATVPGYAMPGSIIVRNPGPTLSVAQGITTPIDAPIQAPVQFTGGGVAVAATTFSLDFDHTCLRFDATDGNADGIPDAIVFAAPPAFTANASYDATDLDGEFDFLIADMTPPLATLPDSVLATVTLIPTCTPPTAAQVTATVNFGADPAPSFSDTNGRSIPGSATAGSIVILGPVLILPGSITGFVFADSNGDGVQNAAETGLPGITVAAYQNGTQVQTGASTSDGSFAITGLTPGTYSVEVVVGTVPAGYRATTTTSQTVSFTNGGAAAANFGFQALSRVEGIVFGDTDGDGTKDAGETGLAGVLVTLSQGATTVATTTSSADGGYAFSSLIPGAYAVVATTPANHRATTATPQNVNAPSGGAAAANHGFQALSRIEGTVFSDTDGDGTQDSGETGLAGVALTLSQGATTIATTSSGADGSYAFNSLIPGAYSVSAVTPANHRATTATTQNVNATSGGVATAGFGFQLLARVEGTVFRDTDGNGIQNNGEVGIGGVLIGLRLGATAIATAITSLNGSYNFADIVPGAYSVASTTPPGHTATTAEEQAITLTNGQSRTVNFGYRTEGGIEGIVYVDHDGDGTWDAGEPGVANVKVALVLGESRQEVQTNASGVYGFFRLTPESYTVQVDTPAGYMPTSQTQRMVVVSDNSVIQADFGFRQSGMIFGMAFEDVNGNSVQNPGEAGLAALRIVLLQGGVEVSATTTDADGGYSFAGRQPGTYIVSAATPANYAPVSPIQREVSLPDGGIVNINYAFQQFGVVSGINFIDANGNGVQDGSETGLAGVRVTLLRGSSSISTTATEANGGYRFAGVTPGTYTVRVAPPADYVLTTPTERTVDIASGGAASASFGFQAKGTIAGIIFQDINGNGVQDTGDQGISGVSVVLSAAQRATAVASVTTNSDGFYRFADLQPGNYVAEVIPPPRFTPTTAIARTTVLPSGGSVSVNFGFQSQGAVSGKVFEDANGDRVQQVSEIGLGGVRIVLSSSLVTITLTTSADGSYGFSDVQPGAYTVIEEDPAGYVSTTPNSVDVLVASGGAASANFGDRRVGTVSGVVFEDTNGNGTQDRDELGIGGVPISLVGSSDTITVSTAPDGSYTFGNVPLDAYSVTEQDLPGYSSTTPNNMPALVTANGGAAVNFGDQRQGTIGGIVYHDLNANQRQDDGEPGLADVVVSIGDGQGATTGGNGAYRFDNVTPGRYTVVETDPAGFGSSTSNTVIVSLGANGSATANFGDIQPGQITGQIYNDINGNGTHDAGEGGMGGVVVALYQTGLRATVVTAGNGSYSFPNLEPGNYSVVEVDPRGYVSTTPNRVLVRVPSNGGANVDFGDQGPGAIFVTVFFDANGSGDQDASEPGLGGVKVELKDDKSTVFATQFTDVNGNVQFTNLPAQAFIVEETDPDGYSSTTPNQVTVDLRTSSRVVFGDADVGLISGLVVLARDRGQTVWVPLGGVQVEVWNSSRSSMLYHTSTAGNGRYVFMDLPPGNYWVHEINPSQYWSLTSDWVSVHLDSNSSAMANFQDGYDPCVFGIVYSDLNLDGFLTDGEPTLSGVPVRLVNVVDGTVAMSGTTDSEGAYLFQNAAFGSYLVEIDPPEGWTLVTEHPVAVALIDKDQGETVTFGLSATEGQIDGKSSGRAEITYGTVRGAVTDVYGKGLSGVKITLFDATGMPVTDTQTLIDGSYSIEGAPVGPLLVASVDLAGYLRATPAEVSVSVTPGKAAMANFIYAVANQAISGYVFVDANANGRYDRSENGIGGVPVRLRHQGNVLNSTTTAANGLYVFPAVEDIYEIVAEDVAGYASTTPNSVSNFGPAIIDFGDRPVGSVTQEIDANATSGFVAGFIYNDEDGSGVFDNSERFLGGVLVTLATLDASREFTTVATGDGRYVFREVTPGAYVVSVSAATGFLATTPERVPVWVVESGATAANFGRRYIGQAADSGSIIGRIFVDSNGDQYFARGEKPMVQLPVQVHNLAGDLIAQTASLGNGSFQVTDLTTGIYRISISPPDGYRATTASDFTIPVTGGHLASVHFGLQQAGSIAGLVYVDGDGDQHHANHERGIGGVEINVYDGDSLVAQGTTSANGEFHLAGLSPGAYAVTTKLPTGFVETSAPTIQTVVGGERTTSVSFGIQFALSVGGIAFIDHNGNGEFEDGELPMSGVAIELTDSDKHTRSTVTASDGVFQFMNLVAGIYTVTQQTVTGFNTNQQSFPVKVDGAQGNAVRFAMQPDGNISGLVFYDLDLNRTMDRTEPGLGGLTVYILDVATGVTETVFTRADGSYDFVASTLPGQYVVTLVRPAEFSSTTPDLSSLMLGSTGGGVVNFGIAIGAGDYTVYLPTVAGGAPRTSLLYLPIVAKRQ